MGQGVYIEKSPSMILIFSIPPPRRKKRIISTCIGGNWDPGWLTFTYWRSPWVSKWFMVGCLGAQQPEDVFGGWMPWCPIPRLWYLRGPVTQALRCSLGHQACTLVTGSFGHFIHQLQADFKMCLRPNFPLPTPLGSYRWGGSSGTSFCSNPWDLAMKTHGSVSWFIKWSPWQFHTPHLGSSVIPSSASGAGWLGYMC